MTNTSYLSNISSRHFFTMGNYNSDQTNPNQIKNHILTHHLNLLKFFVHSIVLKKNYTLFKLISKHKLHSLLQILKYSSLFRFQLLNHLTAQDQLAFENRFLLYYMIRSLSYNHQIIIEMPLYDDYAFSPHTPNHTVQPIHTLKYSSLSIKFLYASADWFEREVFDMFGIFFLYHNDLRRILTDYGFQHHPLRKEFPLIGFKEIRYDDRFKNLLSEDVEFSQIRNLKNSI